MKQTERLADIQDKLLTQLRVRVIPATLVLAGVVLLATAGFFFLKVSSKKVPVVASSGRQIPAETLGYQPGVLIIRLKDSVTVERKRTSKVPGNKIRAGIYDIASESLRNLITTKHQAEEIKPILSEQGKKFKKIRDRLYRLQFDSTVNLRDVEEDLRASPDIASVNVDHLYTVSALQYTSPGDEGGGSPPTLYPNDPYLYSSNTWGQGYADLWGLEKIGLTPTTTATPRGSGPSGWDIERGSSDTIIAISDTGVDYNHPDLAGNIWTNSGEVPGNAIDDDGNGYIDDANGFDFVHGVFNPENGVWRNDADGPMDDNYHGTHVAGTAAAVTNNAFGVAGVCWTCRIMPVKGLNSSGQGFESVLIKTIEYAVKNDAQVLNMSWGGTGTSDALNTVLAAASAAGVTLVAAAGNDASDAQGFHPANSPSVITVSSLATDNTRSSFSNFGAKIDVAAPGGDHQITENDRWRNILSLKASAAAASSRDVGSCCRRLAGTSMAAPHVTGVVGLLKSQRPSLDPETIRLMLRQSAHDVNGATNPGWDTDLGSGAVNVRDALLLTEPMTSEISSPTQNTAVPAGAPLIIRGSVGGPLFARYEVSVTAASGGTGWQLIGQGTAAVANGELGTWNVPPRILGGYIIKLVVFAQNDQSLTDVISVGVGQHPGWPKAALFPRTPAFGDLDRSTPGLEMVFGSNERLESGAYLEALHHDGTPIDGWVYETQTYPVNDKPVVVDIDPANSGLEIISVANPMVRVHNERGQILHEDHMGEARMSQMTAIAADATPTNPGLEIITAGSDLDRDTAFILIWDKNLNYLPFPAMRTNKEVRSIPTAANLDGDPESEILIGAMDTKVYAMNLDGTPIAPNWPVDLSWVVDKAVTAANVDAASQPEIVVGDSDGYLYVYDTNGQLRSGWPQRMDAFLNADGVTVADLDLQFSGLEIISADILGNLYAWHNNGTLVPGFPVVLPRSDWALSSTPTVLQLDPATPEPEILIAQGNTIYGVDSVGRVLPEWTISHPGPIFNPVLIDLDADGLQEIVTVGFDQIYVWDTSLSAAGDAPWPEPYLSSTNNSLFERCTYNTTPNACSTKKPEYCVPIGQVINSCGSPGSCGCPTGGTCQANGSCTFACEDGTPVNSCSSPPGAYCTPSIQLINLNAACASADAVTHTRDDCGFCGLGNTYCATDGQCAARLADRGLLGDYFEGMNFNTLRTHNALDPNLDFGPSNGEMDPYHFFQNLVAERTNNAFQVSIRWNGFINIPTSEPVTYYLNGRGTMKLYIDDMNTSILNTPMNGGNSVSRSLAAGWHPIRIELQGFSGSYGVQLGWKVNGQSYIDEFGGNPGRSITLPYIIPHESLAPAQPSAPSMTGQ